jgi:hypothetical protein
MPCFGPLTTGEQLDIVRRSARWRACSRVGVAVLLAVALVSPTRLAATQQAPEMAPPGLVSLGPDDSALGAGTLPDTFPPGWRRPPCPKAKSVVRVREACFAVLAEKPPCDLGYEDVGRCLMPLAKMERTPRSIGRTE